jgi:hypothetical protein
MHSLAVPTRSSRSADHAIAIFPARQPFHGWQKRPELGLGRHLAGSACRRRSSEEPPSVRITPCPPALRHKSHFLWLFRQFGQFGIQIRVQIPGCQEMATVGDLEAPPARRRRVEDQCCIDVSMLQKAGKLGPGTSSVCSWSRGTGIVGAVCLIAEADAIEICGYISTGTGVEPVQEVMRITRVPARFANRPCGRGRGATSIFLLCPGCQSRRRKLYIVGPQCRCRDCHRLGFAVETKSAVGRSLHRAAKARAKLGTAPGIGCPVPERFVPFVAKRGGRGAGRRKYGRLVRQIAEADRVALSAIMSAADRLASLVRPSQP